MLDLLECVIDHGVRVFEEEGPLKRFSGQEERVPILIVGPHLVVHGGDGFLPEPLGRHLVRLGGRALDRRDAEEEHLPRLGIVVEDEVEDPDVVHRDGRNACLFLKLHKHDSVSMMERESEHAVSKKVSPELSRKAFTACSHSTNNDKIYVHKKRVVNEAMLSNS